MASLAAVLAAAPANAIPPFARKYGTACQTCHTVYPKLNPFGEDFRRRSFRFPGVDGDAVKQEPIALGQEEQKQAFPFAIWPGLLPAAVPLGVALDGQAVAHPDVGAAAARAQGGAPFSLQDLVAEAHLLAGGSLDEAITFFAEVTATTRGQVTVENAELHLADLAGPPMLLNLVVGQAVPTLGSFGPHSSYLADTALPSAPVAALLGASNEGFRLGAGAPGLELNGVALGHLTYSVGLAAGATADPRPTLQAWAHVGAFFTGADEGLWHEATVALDLFGAQATSRLGFPGEAGVVEDSALVLGGALRLRLQGVELDASLYAQRHARVQANLAHDGALAWVHADELSWVALPWLVPVVRLEYLSALPDGAAGAWSVRLQAGAAVLFRANLKATLVAQFESAAGVLPGGWGPAGGFTAPTAARPVVALEIEGVVLNLAAAF